MPKCQEFVVPAVLRILEESIPQSGGKEPLDTKPYRCVSTVNPTRYVMGNHCIVVDQIKIRSGGGNYLLM